MYNTKDEIKEWLDKNYIERYIINDDLTVDVNGDVNLISLLINSYIPVKFGIINGIFNCECNSLTSLVNCPDIVTGYFSCAVNNLKSLK